VLGRVHSRDRAPGAVDQVGYDRLGVMGAGALYGATALQWSRFPQNLHASNKPSEHNIANMLPRIVVAQLGTQTHPPALKRTISRSIVLRPGNQSIGAT
jgi:hypothetical protein